MHDRALDAARFRDRPGAEVAAIDLASAKSELARRDERARHLVARSEADGTFVLAKSEDMPGRFFRQGEVLGYVTPASSNIVRVTVLTLRRKLGDPAIIETVPRAGYRLA